MSNQYQLIRDESGKIERVALNFHSHFLIKSNANGQIMLTAIKAFLTNCPREVEVVLLTDKDGTDELKAWLTTFTPSPDYIEIFAEISVGQSENAVMQNFQSYWIRDGMLVTHCDNQYKYVKIRSKIGFSGADLLSSTDSSTYENRSDIILDGGNILVGDDHFLVGIDNVNTAQTLSKISELGGDKTLNIYGYDSGQAALDATQSINTTSALKGLFDEKSSRLFPQEPFHLDLAVSMTGLYADVSSGPAQKDKFGRYPILLLGQPTAIEGLSPRQKTHLQMDQDIISATKNFLERQGFHVIFNPKPLAPVPQYGGVSDLRAYYRLYNNVLVESFAYAGRITRRAWLPIFGDVEPEMKRFDDQNIKIWEDLGFEVLCFPGWSSASVFSGALRCAVQVLRRSEPCDGGLLGR